MNRKSRRARASLGSALILALASLPLLSAQTLAAGQPQAGGGIIENRGQLNAPAAFYAVGAERAIYFTADAVVLDLHTQAAPPHRDSKQSMLDALREPGASSPACAIWVRFVGANPNARPEPSGELLTRYNFYLGADASCWREGVPVWEAVVYRNLWPGIDLTLHSVDGAVVYVADLAPGADPERVAFDFSGMDAAVPLPTGGCQLETGAGAFAWMPTPDRNEPGTRDISSCLDWATYLGGSGMDVNWGTSVPDADANLFIAGQTASADFPTTPGAYDEEHNGSSDIFLVKLNNAGDILLWGTFMGGSAFDLGGVVRLDSESNVVVSGYTESTNFPVTSGVYDTSYNGGGIDGYFADFDAVSGALLWSTFLGGSSYEWILEVAVAADGSLIAIGNTNSPDYPTSEGAFDDTYNGSYDGFVTAINSTGSVLLWSTYLGGVDGDEPLEICLDDNGNPVVFGDTWSPDFPVTAGAYDTSLGGVQDAFVAKLSSAGDALLWSTFVGGPGGVPYAAWGYHGWGFALDASDAPILADYTSDTAFPTTADALDTTFNGAMDIVLAKLTPDGSDLLYGSFLGGQWPDYPTQLLVDTAGRLVVGAAAGSPTFPIGDQACDEESSGVDAVILLFAADLGAIEWSTYFGGASTEDCAGLSLVPGTDDAFLASGTTLSPDLPTTLGAFDETFNGGTYDSYAARISLTLTDAPALPPSWHLAQNHPNPFNPSTLIEFTLAAPDRIKLDILDVQGRHLRTLLAADLGAGSHAVPWDGRDGQGRTLPSGSYLYRLKGSAVAEQRKAILLK